MFVTCQSDNLVRLTGAATVNMETGEVVPLDAGAAVTFRVQDGNEVDVAGESWPQTMRYIPASAGNFLGLLRDTLQLVEHMPYTLVATVDNGLDQRRIWRLPLIAVVA